MKKILYIIMVLVAAAGCASKSILDEAEQALKDPALKWSESSFTAYIGVTTVFPELTNQYNVNVSYSSSEKGVATISESGVITLLAEGETVITASFGGNSVYEESNAYYTLTVIKNKDAISWSAASCTVTIGADDNVFPTLNNPGNQDITYSSSNTGVATIGSTGAITLVTAGETTIIAKSAAKSTESVDYEATSVSYALTVFEKGSSLVSAELSWPNDTYTAVFDEAFTSPVLNNPHSLSVSYSSSDTGVATISSTGKVTVVSAGTTTITATSEATRTYLAGSASYTLTVSKGTPTLTWSAASYTAKLEDGIWNFPALTITPEGLDITYSSSNESVATISSTGTPSPKAAGSTTVTASFAGNNNYNSVKASYVLTVTSGADTGAGTYTYPSSGEASSEDDISNTTFTRKITVTYSASGATISGYTSDFTVSASGNQVTITNKGTENVVYYLTGTASDGFFKLYSSKKQALHLNGLSLANTAGAVINNQSGKRTFVYVEGTNTLADGTSAAYSASGSEDMKAVFFSEGQLIFSGSGSLTVNANNKQGKAGITSDDYVRFMSSPTVKVVSGSSAGHGVRGKDYITVSDGAINVSIAAAMKKGFSTDSLARIDGGVTTITVTGGSGMGDDGDYSSSAGIKADKVFEMTGGTVTITNSGQGGKGIRVGSSYDESNVVYIGTSYMSGGKLTINTTGSKYTTGDKNPKGLKVGWAVKSSSSGGGGRPGPGGGGGGGHTTYTDMTGDFEMRGGVMTVSSTNAEAIEIKKTLTVNGGEIYAYSGSDDAINTASTFTINDGYVCGITPGNDGLDANGNFYINGGVVYAAGKSSPEMAIDANTEGGFKLYVSGGTLFAIGSLESGASLTQSCYQSSSWSKNAWYSMDVNGKTYAFKTPSSGGSKLVVSGASKPTVKSGVTASGGTSIFNGNGLVSPSVSGGSTVSLSNYSSSGW